MLAGWLQADLLKLLHQATSLIPQPKNLGAVHNLCLQPRPVPLLSSITNEKVLYTILSFLLVFSLFCSLGYRLACRHPQGKQREPHTNLKESLKKMNSLLGEGDKDM